MKLYQFIGISTSSLLITVGMGGHLFIFFNTFGKHNVRSPLVDLFWMLAMVGMVIFIVFLILALIGLFRKSRETPHAEGRPKFSPSGQVLFSVLNLYLSMGLISSVFALHAMAHALAAKGEPTEDGARTRLRKARNLNIVSLVILAAVDLLLISFIGYKICRGLWS